MPAYIKKLLILSISFCIIFHSSLDAQFILNGNASVAGTQCTAGVTTYQLTPDQNTQSGQIWYSSQVSLTQPFDIQFQMYLGSKGYSSGADGICFVFQQQSTNAGSSGGGLGYAGITPSIAVEFDTYQNGWDPGYCHTAIEKNGDVDHTDGSGNNLAGPVQLDPSNPNIPDGNWHNMEITWNPVSKTINVYYDCNLRISYTGDIINTIFGGNPSVYWGFTAGTGGSDNLQEVCITHSYLNNLRDTAICEGASVPLTASGATGSTYSWAPSTGLSSTSTASVTATPTVTTTYTVSITNGCGLTIKDSATIRVSNTTLTTSSTMATCGNNNGTATVTTAGGISPYTFSWNNGQTTTTATNLGVGTYTITTTDSIGCKATNTITVATPPQLVDSITSYTNVSVACGSNGTAVAGVRGGVGPYSYSWSNGQTSDTASNLGAGSYTITVTDANNCTASAIVSITQPGALTASVPSTTPVSCFGGNNGSAIAAITGGNAPYSYSWSNGQLVDTATNLAAGSYTVSITDANGCTVTASTVISQPNAIRDSISSVVNVACFGGANGSAADGIKGGTSPYSFSWSNGQNAASVSGLSIGTYSVTVTDKNGCKDSTTVTISQPPLLTLTAAAFDATCNGTCNGSATVIPKGGTGPYSYLWSNSSTTANDNKLCAGSYSVVVTDANGCVHDSNPLTVSQPPPIVLTKTSAAAFCNMPDGSAAVTASGGTPGYIYQWSNGATTSNLTNVLPGTYTFTVEDANKCLDSVHVTVPNTPGEKAAISSVVNVSCNGGNNGSAIGSASGGSMPYSYSWSNGQATTSDTALSAGTYTFVVTDSSGCKDSAVATITQPSKVSVSTVTPSTICIGQNASISAAAAGGTPPYSFAWNTGCVSAACSVSPAVTTTYTVVAADANNCPSAPATVTVTVNPPLTANTGLPKAMCPGGTVSLNAFASGGDGSYSYLWKPGGATGQSVSVSPTTSTYYTVTVSDACGTPAASDSVLVTVDPLPVVAFSADTLDGCSPLCVSFTDKSTIASGSVQTWLWAFGDGSNSPSQDPSYCYSAPGSYSISLTVTSDSGCSSAFTDSNMITVYSHPAAKFTYSPMPAYIPAPLVSFTDKSTDAYGISQWAWYFADSSGGSPFSSLQNPTHTYTDTGTFCVSLAEVNLHGCTDTTTECVVINPIFTLYIPSAFSPNDDGLNDIFQPKGVYISSFEMYIFDRWGSPVFHTKDIFKGWNGSANNGSTPCQQDTYVYLIYVTDFRGTTHTYIGRVTLVK